MLDKKRNWSNLDFLFLFGGTLTIVVTRWLFKSQYLFHWDSIQFVMALENFDVSRHQPHPPGYVLYVYLGKLFNYLVEDPNLAFILLGIIASVLGLVFTFFFARAAFGKATAYIAALFYTFNPLVWFHGLVAEVYILEMMFVLLFGFLAYRYYRRESILGLISMVLVLGLLGATRQSAEVVMSPLFVFVLFAHKTSVKKWLAALAGLVVVNLAWFIPVLALSGGWSSYFIALNALTRATIIYEYVNNGWDALLNNFGAMLTVLKQAFLPGLLILAVAVLPFVAQESKAKYKINQSLVWFWLMAILPGILIMPIILMRNPGYMLSVASLLIILVALAVVFLVKVTARWRSRLANLAMTVLIAGTLVFEVGNFFTLGFSSLYYLSASLDSVRKVDEYAADIMQTLRDRFNPTESVIWIPGDYVFFGVRHFQYYLPEFEIYAFAPQSFADASSKLPIWHIKGTETSEFIKSIPLPADIRYLVAARDTYQTQEHQVLIETNGGHTMIYYDLADEGTAQFFASDIRFNIQREFNAEGGGP